MKKDVSTNNKILLTHSKPQEIVVILGKIHTRIASSAENKQIFITFSFYSLSQIIQYQRKENEVCSPLSNKQTNVQLYKLGS